MPSCILYRMLPGNVLLRDFLDLGFYSISSHPSKLFYYYYLVISTITIPPSVFNKANWRDIGTKHEAFNSPIVLLVQPDCAITIGHCDMFARITQWTWYLYRKWLNQLAKKQCLLTKFISSEGSSKESEESFMETSEDKGQQVLLHSLYVKCIDF